MEAVVVAGVGVTEFGRFPGRSPASLAQEAARAALRDAGITPRDVGAAFCGSVFSGPGAGQRVLKDLGLVGLPVVNLENACASSSTAVFEGLAWLGAGLAEVVLCVGVESLTANPDRLGPDDGDIIGTMGVVWPAVYGLKARRHMAEYGSTPEQFAEVAVKNRRHAALNPKAQFKKLITAEEVLASRPICEPLTLLQCCPPSDGASAVVLMTEERARSLDSNGRPVVRIAGSAIRSGVFADQSETGEVVTTLTSRLAYERAGVGPDDVDVCEVHDAFTVGEVLHYEALGFCEPGGGGRYVETGKATLGGGGVVVNPGGGLLSRGHPLGATGGAQLVEIATQLRGEAGRRQVDGARVGLTHTMGGTVYELESNVCVVHVLTA
ncbi:MAG: thiolase family protein [Actinomycetota bacterium]|jgi:acetyl-CoA acetyltransferase